MFDLCAENSNSLKSLHKKTQKINTVYIHMKNDYARKLLNHDIPFSVLALSSLQHPHIILVLK